MRDDGSPDGEDSPGSWREHEQVDEQYREPDPESVDIGPPVPEAPEPSEGNIDGATARRFWALVTVFNVALLALSLGAMFVLFEGNYTLGGQLLVAGAAVFGFGLYRYRTAKAALLERSGGGLDDSDARNEQDTETPEEQD